MSDFDRAALTTHVMRALQESIAAHGEDTPEVRVKFFLKLVTASLASMANYATAETVRAAAAAAAEAALAVASEVQQETLQ